MNSMDRRLRRASGTERDEGSFQRITEDEVNEEIARLEAGEPGRIPMWRYNREIDLLQREIAWFDAGGGKEEYPKW